MRPGGDRLRGELDPPRREVGDEVVPLPVDHDAAQVEDHLRAIASPAHPGAVEPQADEVAHGALDGSRADVEIVTAELGVAHAALVFGEILHDAEQPLSAALVAGSGLGDLGEGSCEHVVHLRELASPEPALLVGNPGAEVVASLAMNAAGCLPELLGNVIPVDARHSVREVLLLVPPDVIGAVGKEQGLLLAVAPSDRVLMCPAE